MDPTLVMQILAVVVQTLTAVVAVVMVCKGQQQQQQLACRVQKEVIVCRVGCKRPSLCRRWDTAT